MAVRGFGAIAAIPAGERVRVENTGGDEARLLVVLSPPDFAGHVGGVAAAIGLDAGWAVGLWVVLAARAVAAVPFARTQVRRLEGRADQRPMADTAQLGIWWRCATG